MITAGMLVLLTMSVISANRLLMEVNEATYEAEALTASATIASDLLDEILSKKFDKNANSDGNQNPTEFSDPLGGPPGEWGPEGPKERDKVRPLPDTSSTGDFKSDKYFDDVDDYIGYSRLVTMNSISGFLATVNVYYVDSSAPDVPLTVQSAYKKIVVTVTHPVYMPTPQVYTALASY
jgi:hypothetical protein